MKLLFKILSVLLLIIFVAMLAIPYFFRDQIVGVVKEEINKNVNVKVDFESFDLSLFRSFPNFDFQLRRLSVINKAPFQGDTLAYIPSLNLTLDLVSVFRGEAYELKKISIDQAVINALVSEDGTANWDVTIESPEGEETGQVESGDSESPVLIKLRSVVISNARIVYDDKSLMTYALLDGVDHSLSGDFTLDFTTLKTHTIINAFTVVYDGVKYFDKINAGLDADIDADLMNKIYTLKNNELRLNNLFIGFDGSVGMQVNGDINTMITYSTVKSEFKNFLSLIPAIYSKDFDGLKTSGTLALTGNVKGIYNDVSYPAFAFNLLIQDGYFQYPDLPKAVENVNMDARIAYPGGDFDKLTVDVPKFNLTMAGNNVAALLAVRKPMTNLALKGEINGVIDLAKVKDFYPLGAGDDLSGKITSNVSFEGEMSALEKEQYDDFKFLGSILIENLKYTSSFIPQQLDIKKAQLNFSPEYLDLVNFNINFGQNDFSAKGRIENFLPYLLADGILVGNLETTSPYFNIGDLMPETEETEETADTLTQVIPQIVPTDTTSGRAIEIPGNIDFTFTADYKKVLYDNIELNNISGRLTVKNSVVSLEKLKMGVIDGSLTLSGKFDANDPAMPYADMDFAFQNINFKTAYSTFGAFEKFAPIAEKTDGKFSTQFSINTMLDNDLMPVYSSVNGGGNLQTTSLTIENVNSLNKIADLLKMPDLKRLLLSPVKVSFGFINGKLHVKPFDINYQDMKANIGGWTSFDQTIGYDMVMTIPRNKFVGQANAILGNLVNEANKSGTNFSLGETVNVKASIVGTVSDPQVKVLPGEGSGKNMMDDLKKKAQGELDKQKKKLEGDARKELEKNKAEAKKKADKILADADAKANKIIADAQKKADNLVK